MPLFRVVEAPEANALGASRGLPTRPPTGQESKPFFTTWEQALRYQEQIDRLFGPTQIWRFDNPDDVGEEGPPVDTVPGPTWHVPNSDLARLSPGERVN
ncbi:MAG: hypothetical protein AMXMBFR81_13610 [Chthonomonas sp.]